ncbi:hypothetical protein KBT16_24700 [Nostoc sp. CCCryo 231-06]|nr:hypothetical protein [Nostoc sp. CCCryo 231-06]
MLLTGSDRIFRQRPQNQITISDDITQISHNSFRLERCCWSANQYNSLDIL